MITGGPLRLRAKLLWLGGHPTLASRYVPEQRAVALTFGGSTNAVMMATPADLEDFGVGFAFTEGIIEQADEITSIEIVKSSFGIEIRMWLDRCRAEQLSARRRARKSVAGLRGATACSKQGNLSRARSVERHGQDPTLARAQRKDRGAHCRKDGREASPTCSTT